ATACEKSPAQPTSVTAPAAEAATSTTDARTGVTLTSPVGTSPANNAQVKFGDQPITLVVTNVVTSGSTPLTYIFEVATDGAFQSIVQTKGDVTQGTGQTS